MLDVAQLNRGMAVDVIVGDSIAIQPMTGRRIVVTIEAKSGQRTRLRIQSDDAVKIEIPKRLRPS